MSSTFTYSILQYKHSLLLSESVNVGVLFYFPANRHMEFIPGNLQRVKSIYPDFSVVTFNTLIKNINARLNILVPSGLVNPENLRRGLNNFINEYLLNEDESSLQFTNATSVIDTYNDIKITTEKFSKLFLPGLKTKKPEIVKHH